MLAFSALGIPSPSLPAARSAAEKPSSNFLYAPCLRSSAGLRPHPIGHRPLFSVPSDAVDSTQQPLAALDNSLFRHVYPVALFVGRFTKLLKLLAEMHLKIQSFLSSNSQAVVSRDEALMLYEDMVLGRFFEDMCAQMYYRSKMFGFVDRRPSPSASSGSLRPGTVLRESTLWCKRSCNSLKKNSFLIKNLQEKLS